MQETSVSAGHQVMADTERTELIVDHTIDVRESVSTSWRHLHWPAMLDKQVLAAAAVVSNHPSNFFCASAHVSSCPDYFVFSRET